MSSIALLSSRFGWHERDLIRAARRLGVAIEVADFRDLHARVGAPPEHGPRLGAGTLDLAAARAVIVRTMPAGSLEQIIFRMDLLHRIEKAGVPVVNSPRSLEAAIDKYLSIARLESASIPVPPTRVAQDARQAMMFFEELGGDVIVKPLFGSEGKGQERLTSRREAERTLGTLGDSGAVLYLQKFISHPGHDLRLFTCGDEVTGAIRRTSTGGWMTNVARGGLAEAVEPEPALKDLALRAAAAVGTEIAGIDVLPDREGRYHVLEVNGSPGWKALSKATGVDVAARVLEYVLEK